MVGRTDGSDGTAWDSRGTRGVSRAMQLISLIDRARHDRGFGDALRREPVVAAARMGLTLSDAEWGGLRDLLND